ncbi:MAG TPA: NAD(P)/FAD-dependent oxidoreductase [Chthoniobacter sp.]
MSGGAEFYDVIVLGAGAAGLMCAIEAGKRGRRVLVIEHNDRVGKKILISGGGRCNFTNLGVGPGNYLSQRPNFCKSALARYTPRDFVALVEKHGVAYHEKKLGQQFCNGSSRDIVNLLLEECARAGVEIRVNCRVSEVRKTDRFQVESNLGAMECDSCVVATGGLSFPKLGATDFGYRVARQFGLPLTETRPGLVPLTFGKDDAAMNELSGLSVPVIARFDGAAFEENLLFTHRGVSGPAVLQISSFWREGKPVAFDLLPGLAAGEVLEKARREAIEPLGLLSRYWPRRFAEVWCSRYAPGKKLPHLTVSETRELTIALEAWPLQFSGTEGYAKAEVTLGGVDTGALSSKTMEAREAPGLFFIGEVVDVTGWLGGYNFQWAWASGYAAGQAV